MTKAASNDTNDTGATAAAAAAAAALSPLFWLPVELLEEISQFLKRREAAQVLTVNSVLHDVFAHRIWRNIGVDDQPVWGAPLSAWKRYGHLVRSVCVERECPRVNLVRSVCFEREYPWVNLAELPGLVRLDVRLSSETQRVFDHQMPQLQSVRICHATRHGHADRDTIMKAANWIFAMEERGQEVDVEWRLNAYTEKQWDWLEELLVLITKPERHSFTLWSATHFMPGTWLFKQMPKLAAMLTDMSFKNIRRDIDASYFTSIIADNTLAFNKLRRAEFALPSRDLPDAQPVPNLLASRFPVLKSLELSWIDASGATLTRPFFHGSLASLSSLRLEKCNNECWNNIVGCVPNVQKLTFDACVLRFGAQVVAKQIPLLRELVAHNGSGVDFVHDGKCRESAATIAAGQFLKLASVEVWAYVSRGAVASDNLYEFMVNHAPNLRIVRIYGDKLTVPLSDEVRNATNPSVKQLYFCGKSVADYDFELMLKLFPKLTKFDINCPAHNHELLGKMRAQYPSLSVIASQSPLDWNPKHLYDSDDSDYYDDHNSDGEYGFDYVNDDFFGDDDYYDSDDMYDGTDGDDDDY